MEVLIGIGIVGLVVTIISRDISLYKERIELAKLSKASSLPEFESTKKEEIVEEVPSELIELGEIKYEDIR